MSWAIEMKDYSQRRACALVGIAPHVLRCQSSRLDDAGLRQRVRELSSGRRRFGYRRLHLLLRREGADMSCNPKSRHVRNGMPSPVECERQPATRTEGV